MNNEFQVSLISPYSDLTNIGLRSISMLLRNAGYRTQMIFLPTPSSELPLNTSPYFVIDYPEHIIRQLADITKDSQIIGISLMDNYMQIGIKLTQALKKESNLLLWGGVFPSMDPESALHYADAVCIGEGEDAMLELVRKMDTGQDINTIPNIWIKGETRPESKYITDISALPLPDYGPEGHFVYSEKEQMLASLEACDEYENYIFSKHRTDAGLVTAYHMETTRGCPHNCTYCGNNILKKIISSRIRKKDVGQIKKELLWVKEKFPSINSVCIEDDCFIYRKNINEIVNFFKDQEFSFKCLISPQQFSEEKLDYLVENGLMICQIGLQSKAPRIEEMYNRVGVNKNCDKLFRYLKKHSDIPIIVDILVNNPWERTEDTLYTLNYLIDNMPPKAILGINSLVFYRGTKLYENAKQDGLLETNYLLKTWHWHRQKIIHYITLLFVLLNLRFPRTLIRFFAAKPFIFFFERDLFARNIFPWIITAIKKTFSLFTANMFRKERFK